MIVVSSTKERVQDVKNSVDRRLNYVLQTLRNKHVKESEMHVTKTLSRAMIDGVEQYCLNATVSISVHDILLYQTINNQIVEKLDRHVVVSTPEFTHEPGSLEHARRQASLLAAKNCRQKALELAQAVGTRLGAVLSIHEDCCQESDSSVPGVDATPSDRVQQWRAQDATLRITAKVTVTFELRSSAHRRKEQKS